MSDLRHVRIITPYSQWFMAIVMNKVLLVLFLGYCPDAYAMLWLMFVGINEDI